MVRELVDYAPSPGACGVGACTRPLVTSSDLRETSGPRTDRIPQRQPSAARRPSTTKIFLEPRPLKTTTHDQYLRASSTSPRRGPGPARPSNPRPTRKIRRPRRTCVEIKILRRVRAEPSRRPPRHRRDACSVHPTHWLISTQPTTCPARRPRCLQTQCRRSRRSLLHHF